MVVAASDQRSQIDQAAAGITLCSAFAATAERCADLPAIRWRSGDGWERMTWAAYREAVIAATLGLQSLGAGRGGFGLILSRNRPEHMIADLALVHAGLTPVSAYTTLAPAQLAYIANHCEAEVAVVEDENFLRVLLEVRDQLPHLRHVILLTGSHAEARSWDDVVGAGRALTGTRREAFEESWRLVQPEDAATLIYTSGTTGPPKAVTITHHNIAWVVESAKRIITLSSDARLVSYLPMAHVAERFTGHWTGLFYGNSVHMCPDLAELGTALAAARPTFFFGPPRVWEKLHAGITAAVAAEPDAQRRSALENAIDTGRAWVAREQSGAPPDGALTEGHAAAAPVLAAMLARLGLDQCTIAMTGAAPISPETITFFRALGLPLTEIWGMSELTGPGTYFMPSGFRIGTVGVAMPGVELRTADDGELEVRGGLVMRGYYRDPERTAETISPDGWLRTGDVATIDDDGFVRIVDRKKELIITAGGKNVSPVLLESLLKAHRLIGQTCAVGDRRPYITALIGLDGEVAPVWAAQHGLSGSSTAELARHPEVIAEIRRAVQSANAQVSRAEAIRRFVVLDSEWTAGSGELTPTLKMRRQVVLERHAGEIEGMYAGTAGYEV